MTSAIDITKPVYGNPTTQSVRDNFSAASNEITALQNDVVNRVRKDGDTMTGPLNLSGDPQLALHAANRSWVLNQILSTANALIYVGDYDAAADRVLTSGQASIAIGSPLPAAAQANTQMFFTVKVGKNPPSIGNQPPGGVPIGTWLISNGVIWNVYQPTAVGVTAQTVPVNPEIAGLPGTNVYDALSSVPALYLPLAGGLITGNLQLANNPTIPGHAATKAYVDSLASSVAVSDTPPGSPKAGSLWWDSVAGQLYISYQDADSQQWVVANSSGGFVDAPTDGITYARRNAAWSSVDALIAPYQNNAGRNLLQNSMFRITQRGVGPWTAGPAWTADRWIMSVTLDTASFSIAAVNDTIRGQIGDEAATNLLSNTFTGNAGATAQNFVRQGIEDVRRLAGKTVTISFWAAASAALNLGISMRQNFGTGGSPSAVVTINGVSRTLSAVWARYSATFTLPSIAGKTLGSNSDHFTQVIFWYSSGANSATESAIGVQSGTIQLWGVQCEIGTVMTPLEKIDIQTDFANCQRFYQFIRGGFIGYQSAGVNGGHTIEYPVRMRATPSAPTINTTYTSNCGNVTSAETGVASIFLIAVATTTGAMQWGCDVFVSADL